MRNTTHFCHLTNKTEYYPAVKANPKYTLKAVYSRSQQSATKFGEEASVEAYYDTPASPEKSLAKLLERSDIDAVIIALSINAQPDVIRSAWKAGKHVLSEKPIAKDSTIAKQLIEEYKPYKENGQLWAIAENFRYLDPIVYGTEQLKRLGGEVASFQVSIHSLVKAGNIWYETAWYVTSDFIIDIAVDAALLDFGSNTAHSQFTGEKNQRIKEASFLTAACTSLLV